MAARAYLTIDDAPTATTEAKLEALADRDVTAVWFCIGEALESNPDPAIRAIEAGHVVANHTYSHPRFSDLSLERCLEEIDRTEELVAHCYARTGRAQPVKAFRFPYGDDGSDGGADPERAAAIQDALRERGYVAPTIDDAAVGPWCRPTRRPTDVDWGWTLDVREWEHDDLKSVLERLDRGGPDARLHRADDGTADVILLHDHDRTADWFEPILDRLLECGVTFEAPPV